MADCKSCHWAGYGGGGNFGYASIVCGCPAETDWQGDCPEYEFDEDDQDTGDSPLTPGESGV